MHVRIVFVGQMAEVVLPPIQLWLGLPYTSFAKKLSVGTPGKGKLLYNNYQTTGTPQKQYVQVNTAEMTSLL